MADDLGALAVGALTGRDRVAVLDHVEHCATCAVELESLATGADALLSLYPEVDPATTFTERVLTRIDGESHQPPPPRRPRRIAVMVAASIAALALLGGVVAAIVASDRGSGPTTVTAVLRSRAGPDGSVVLTSHHGNWLVMTLDDAGASGSVTCRVTLSDGSARTIGQFTLRGGYGSWAVRLPTSPSTVEAVTVIGQNGTVVASAAL
ncbi:MAG TPA: hypothetical protein VEG62_06630 [Acidimicrobiales bacterium]|nr:hypothetical protein [Acidimicrobiales bacterium]